MSCRVKCEKSLEHWIFTITLHFKTSWACVFENLIHVFGKHCTKERHTSVWFVTYLPHFPHIVVCHKRKMLNFKTCSSLQLTSYIHTLRLFAIYSLLGDQPSHTVVDNIHLYSSRPVRPVPVLRRQDKPLETTTELGMKVHGKLNQNKT